MTLIGIEIISEGRLLKKTKKVNKTDLDVLAKSCHKTYIL